MCSTGIVLLYLKISFYFCIIFNVPFNTLQDHVSVSSLSSAASARLRRHQDPSPTEHNPDR